MSGGALRIHREERNTCCLAAIRLQALPTLNPKRAQDVKKYIVPRTAEMHMKGMILVSPDSCIFPYIEKHYIP